LHALQLGDVDLLNLLLRLIAQLLEFRHWHYTITSVNEKTKFYAPTAGRAMYGGLFTVCVRNASLPVDSRE
jgi:hypothetical protein